MIEDFPSSYPIPPLITLTSISCPLLTIGVNLAKDPTPLSTKLGGVLYWLPLALITTSIILPLLITGLTKALFPLWKSISGCLSKLKISEEPYPVPLLVKSTESILPLNLAWILDLKSWLLKVAIPILPSIVTVIGL